MRKYILNNIEITPAANNRNYVEQQTKTTFA